MIPGIPQSVFEAREPGGDFTTLLHTLAQYALLDDRIGMEQTGYVLGRFMARHWPPPAPATEQFREFLQRPIPPRVPAEEAWEGSNG